MTSLAIQEDVVDRLGRPLTTEEATRVDALIREASALVIGYLGGDPTPADMPIAPDSVVIVVSRMVARLIQQQTSVVGAESQSQTSGPFQFTTNYTPGSTSGGPWLAAQDKIMLRPYRVGGGVGSLNAASFQTGSTLWSGV